MYEVVKLETNIFVKFESPLLIITFKIGDMNTERPVKMNTITPVTLCSLKTTTTEKNSDYTMFILGTFMKCSVFYF